jgi:hypothetical protein
VAEQAAEVIPSEARNLSCLKTQEKRDSSLADSVRNDKAEPSRKTDVLSEDAERVWREDYSPE